MGDVIYNSSSGKLQVSCEQNLPSSSLSANRSNLSSSFKGTPHRLTLKAISIPPSDGTSFSSSRSHSFLKSRQTNGSMNHQQSNRNLRNNFLNVISFKSSNTSDKPNPDISDVGRKNIPSSTSENSFKFNVALLEPSAHNYKTDLQFKDISDVRLLCKGSHSDLYKGVYQHTPVVIKVISDDFYDNPLAVKEFDSEAQLLSRLSHRHVIGIVGRGTLMTPKLSVGKVLIALEYLEGNTLKHHMALPRPHYSRPFSEARALRMARELADALQYLHDGVGADSDSGRGDCVVVHRDLKPDNIGFTADGVLKLLDFGLCVAVRRGAADSAGAYKLSGV